MVDRYIKLVDDLNNPELPHYQRQCMEAAIVMLKEFMEFKTRDIKRHIPGA